MLYQVAEALDAVLVLFRNLQRNERRTLAEPLDRVAVTVTMCPARSSMQGIKTATRFGWLSSQLLCATWTGVVWFPARFRLQTGLET